MKSIFVVLPLGMENALEVASRIALKASEKVGEYLYLLSPIYDFGVFSEQDKCYSKTNEEVSELSSAIRHMAEAEYVAFHPDWRKHKHCQLLRAIAEAYNLNILELDSTKELEFKPCPFCGGTELIVVHSRHGCGIKCRKCNTHTAILKNEDEAIALWNGSSE